MGAGTGVLSAPAILRSNPARAQSKVVNVMTYDKFIPEDFKQQFYSDTGIEIRVKLTDEQGKQFNMLAAEAPNPSTDIATVAGHRFHQFLDSDLLEPIDTGRLKNWNTVNEVYRNAPWLRIRDEIWGVPLLMGCTGLTRNTDYVSEGESWEVMFDPKYEGLTAYIIPDFIEVVMQYLGYDGNFIAYIDKPEEGQAAINAARDFIIEHKNMVRKFYDGNAEAQQMFMNEDIYLAQTWSGAPSTLIMDDFPVRFTVPKEGGFGFVYNYNITKNSENLDNAYLFLDAALGWEGMGATMTRATGFVSAFAGAADRLTEKERAASSFSQEQLERIHFYRSENADMKYEMIDRAVAEIQAS
jgi:spermidine/putrescine transport system substrate-binding protein